MPYKDPDKRRANEARPENREKSRQRDRERYQTPERQAWLAGYRQTDEFKKRNYETVKEWRGKPESKPKRAAQANRWRAKNPEKAKQIVKRSRALHVDKFNETRRKRHAADPEGNKRRSLAYKARMLAEQEAVAGRPRPIECEICGPTKRRIVFDHCHTQGKFRGWLCDRCNTVLGIVDDDATLLDRLAAYLREHGSGPIDRTATKKSANGRLRDSKQASLPLGHSE